ncbi:AAA family ATPase [Congregibacter variabilis]|uniref:AAA family ATPase n=1 Tax=Congregibacter variabilis TaxID=3081200 RepID=A0ABZ0I6D6_9GAMM|nr:AAA family ATPase [Congregibacter sp. IMCC43200]
MYDQFYGFVEEPFRLSPDHHFAYQHRGYKKARAYMAYAFSRAEGFVMVTGRPGTGKTTLVGALIDDLANERAQIANLVCSQLQADDLLSMVAHEFGVDLNITNKGQQLQYLSRQLQKWHREGRRALLVVDEAQDLSITAMEELRLLTNIQIGGKPLLQIFLLGQPELRELILRPEMEQVHQRIVAASHLQALEPDETEEYIRHRLSSAGWQGDPDLSTAVFPLISKFSEGIPRRINLICSRLLLHGCVEQLHRIGVDDLRQVVEELQGESLAAGSVFSDHDFDVVDEFEGDAASRPREEASGGAASGSEDNWRRRMRRRSRAT